MQESGSEGKSYSISNSLDEEKVALLHRFDRGEYRARREASLRLYVLLLVTMAGMFLVGIAAYLALMGFNSSTTMMMFLFSGVFLLVLAVTAVLGVGVFKSNNESIEKKNATRRAYFDEINSE